MVQASRARKVHTKEARTTLANSAVRSSVSPAADHALLQLQRTLGNRRLQRLLSSRTESGVPNAPGLSIQRQPLQTDVSDGDTEEGLTERIEAASQGGSSLGLDVQRRLEFGLGADVSNVRVHTDMEADQLARAVDAVAFTTGQHIFFRAGNYDPTAPEGLWLLAHETAHTVQQAAGSAMGTPDSGGVTISEPGDAFEQAADEAADLVTAGHSPTEGPYTVPSTAPLSATDGLSIAREDDSSWLGDAWDVITNNAIAGGAGLLEEAANTGTKLPKILSPSAKLGGASPVSAALAPLGLISGAMGLSDAITRENSSFEDRAGDVANVAGLASSTITSAGLLGSGLTALSGTGAASSLGLAGAASSAGGGLTAAAGALGPVGAVLGAGAGGYAAGTWLSENTSVGEHSVDVMGGIDAWLTDPGERSWMLETTESLEEDWDQGNYGSALWSGTKLAGAGTLGALGGIGGGIVDAGEAIGGGIADAAEAVWDLF